MVNARTTLLAMLLAFLRLCNCVFSAQNIVSKKSALAISITFLDMDAPLDSYFRQLQPMEMSAKTGSPITG